jgi:DNA-binding protein YbaB
MNGHQKILSITIAKEAVDPEDVEMLQDLIMSAINEAAEKAQQLSNSRMGGFNIPGLT